MDYIDDIYNFCSTFQNTMVNTKSWAKATSSAPIITAGTIIGDNTNTQNNNNNHNKIATFNIDKPTITITAAKYLTFAINITKNTFKNIIFRYNQNGLKDVILKSQSLTVKLPNHKSIKIFLQYDYKFNTQTHDKQVKLKQIGTLETNYIHKTNKDNYNNYMPIKFNIKYQEKIMDLIIQKDDDDNLRIFKMCSAGYLHNMPTISSHAIFDPYGIDDKNFYDVRRSIKKPVGKLPMSNSSFNSNSITNTNTNTDKTNSIKQVIKTINTLLEEPNMIVSEFVTTDMFYANIKYHDMNYHINFDPIMLNNEILFNVIVNNDKFVIQSGNILKILLQLLYYKNKHTVKEITASYSICNGKRNQDDNGKTESEDYIDPTNSWWDYIILKPIWSKILPSYV